MGFFHDSDNELIALLSLVVALHTPNELRLALDKIIDEINSYEDKAKYEKIRAVLFRIKKLI